ncbi:hypothetical protein [Fimbriiglobus ruber]|uniref:Uncharacterized protein n=1 Tax=Fimbriiglobus ruber TaxID=1908690 RepID=A0A225E3Y3_9BACT|nr:hypothetical protein [Fimbriiglobus ruber]OWK43395.1 hypothetical protein FRUB_02994 [Fimbriiglobus ruber]
MYAFRPVALILIALVALVPAVGCGFTKASDKKGTELIPEKTIRKKSDEVTPEQEAIFRILDDDKHQLKQATDGLSEKAQPSAVTKVIGAYADHFEKVDLGVTTKEFKEVYEKHMKAWRALHVAIRKLPDAYAEGEFVADLVALFRTDGQRGKSLGGDVTNGVKKVLSTYTDVLAAAETAGLEVVR